MGRGTADVELTGGDGHCGIQTHTLIRAVCSLPPGVSEKRLQLWPCLPGSGQAIHVCCSRGSHSKVPSLSFLLHVVVFSRLASISCRASHVPLLHVSRRDVDDQLVVFGRRFPPIDNDEIVMSGRGKVLLCPSSHARHGGMCHGTQGARHDSWRDRIITARTISRSTYLGRAVQASRRQGVGLICCHMDDTSYAPYLRESPQTLAE